MKYEYQDAIINELINQKKAKIDPNTINTATFNVFNYEFGQYKPNPEYCRKNCTYNIHMHIINGSIFGVCDLKGSEYSIDFTVYEIDNPAEHNNHIMCFLNIT